MRYTIYCRLLGEHGPWFKRATYTQKELADSMVEKLRSLNYDKEYEVRYE